MRRWVVLALLLGLVLAQSGDFYPRGVGLGWAYSSGEVQIFAREQAGMLLLEHRFPGKPVYGELLRYSPQGVFLEGTVINGQVQRYQPALMLYPPAPMVLGQEWGGRSVLNGSTIALLARVERIEGVSVPAGRYNAYVIRTSLVTEAGGSVVVESYFVPGVGIVRYASPDGGTIDLVRVLKP